MLRPWLQATLSSSLALVAGACTIQLCWGSALSRSFMRAQPPLVFLSEVAAGWLGLGVTVALALALRSGRRAPSLRIARGDLRLVVTVFCALTFIASAAHAFGLAILPKDAETARVLALTGPAYAGLEEETVYRGCLLWSLAGRGRTQALVASALAFGLGHVPGYGLGEALSVQLPAGLVYGTLLLRTRSLMAVIAVHASYDVVALGLEAASGSAPLHRGLTIAMLAASGAGVLGGRRQLLRELRRLGRTLVRFPRSPRRVAGALAAGSTVGIVSILGLVVWSTTALLLTAGAIAAGLLVLRSDDVVRALGGRVSGVD